MLLRTRGRAWVPSTITRICNYRRGNLRIIECFGLGPTSRGHLAHPLCSEQGYFQLDQIVQIPVQPGLEYFQGRGLHYLSRQPVSVFHHSDRKKFLPHNYSESTFP